MMLCFGKDRKGEHERERVHVHEGVRVRGNTERRKISFLPQRVDSLVENIYI